MSYYSASATMSSRVSTPRSGAKSQLLAAKRELYRGAILTAAEAVFAEHGYDAAKVQRIAEQSGLSLATLYATFPKKWDVFRAYQALRLRELMVRVGRVMLRARDPFERMRCGIEGYLRFHMEHPAFLRVQLHERVPWGTIDELRTPEQTEAWHTGLQMLTEAFREGMAEGLWERDDPELCARMATAMSQVRLVAWVSQSDPAPPDDVACAAMRQFLRVFASERARDLLLQRLSSTSWDGSAPSDAPLTPIL